MKRLLVLAGVAAGLFAANLNSDAVVVLKPVSGSTMICSNITYWGAEGGASGLSNNFAGVWQAAGDALQIPANGERVALTNALNVVGWGSWDGTLKAWTPGGTSNETWYLQLNPRCAFFSTNGSTSYNAYIILDILRNDSTTSSITMAGGYFGDSAGHYVNAGDVVSIHGDEKIGVVFSADKSDIVAIGSRFSFFKVAGP